MTVSETSLEAYYSIKKCAKPRTIAVRNYIEANPASTNEDVARGLRMRIQGVTPRTRELKMNGLLWITGFKWTDGGRRAYTMKVPTCPFCLSTRIEATRLDLSRFSYYCWTCGRRFTAYVGENANEPVEVVL